MSVLRDFAVKHSSLPGRPRRMFDSVSVAEIPVNARAVAGYVGGRWTTYDQLKGKHPYVVPIAIDAQEVAHCLDIEAGDASNAEVARWLHTYANSNWPILYTSLSNAQALVNELAAGGIHRLSYRLWTAHYTGHPHRCTGRECGYQLELKADATQWTDKALGRNLDESLLSYNFFHRRG